MTTLGDCAASRIVVLARRIVAWRWLGFVLSAVVLAACFADSGYWHFPGHDLRNRIVGARAIAAGIDPYDLAAYNGGMIPGPELTDPPSWGRGFSATTAPPPVLEFYRLFTTGDWATIRLFCLTMEWLALLLSIFVLTLAMADRRRGEWIALVLVCVMVSSAQWRWHSYYGQYYIFPTLLVSIDLALLWSGRGQRAGWCMGLAAAFRPMTLALAPLLWILGHRRAAMACAAVAFTILLSSYATQAALWASFSELTGRWVEYYWIEKPVRSDPMGVERFRSAVETASRDGYLRTFGGARNERFSPRLPEWRRHFNRSSIFAYNWKLVSPAVAVAVSGFLVVVAWLGRRHCPRDATILVPALGFVMVELISPVAGYYNAVMLLPLTGALALSLLAITGFRRRLFLACGVLLPYLALTHAHPNMPYYHASMVINTALAVLACGTFLVFAAWPSLRRQHSD